MNFLIYQELRIRAILPSYFKSYLAFFRAPGLTRLLGVKHCVQRCARGQFKYVQSVHAHLHSSGVGVTNCGDSEKNSKLVDLSTNM